MPTIDMSGLPGIESLPDFLRTLMAIGITLFLVIHRFDAERFNAAEYDDIDRWGNPPSLFRRLSWYFLGLLGILAVLVLHPSPETDLYLSLGERLGVIVLGLAYGAAGTAAAVGLAYYRYHYVRLPGVRSYPGAVLNAVATAFVDEAVFRGIVFGFLITLGTDPNLANLAQALLYALATRTGAPGRPKTMLVVMFSIGIVSGWLTGVTGGIVVDEYFRVRRNGKYLDDVLAAGDCAEVKSIVTGKPIWKMPICGAARFRMPSARLAISSAATTGSASRRPIWNIARPNPASVRQPGACSRSADTGRIWNDSVSAANTCRWPSNARNARIATAFRKRPITGVAPLACGSKKVAKPRPIDRPM